MQLTPLRQAKLKQCAKSGLLTRRGLAKGENSIGPEHGLRACFHREVYVEGGYG